MTTVTPTLPARQLPMALYWALLGAVLAVHFLIGPWWALAVGGLGLLQIWRPLGFLPAYLMVVAGGSFVDYSQGHLTSELSVLSVGILFMLFCYLLAMRSEAFTLPRAGLTVPLAGYLGLTLLNFLRGMVVGNSLRYAGLELIAALAMGCTFLVGNLPMTPTAIFTALAGLILMALGNSALGFHEFSVAHQRVGSVYFTAVPGIVALVLFNFALHEKRARRSAIWILFMAPLLVHQFLSFTRGFWLGLSGGFLYSIVAFGGFGAGSAARWRRVVTRGGILFGLVSIGVLLIASVFGISNLLDLARDRLSSSTGTKLTFETSSNIVRLVEYARVIRDIIASPWIGHGLGYYFVVREPIHDQLIEQWYCHESYLLVWLKQGIPGLLLYVSVLVSAFLTAHQASRRAPGLEGAWCAGAAAVTIFVALYSTVYFVLVAEVNTAFLIALLWGGSLSIAARGHWRLRWRAPRGDADPAPDPSP